MDIKRFYEIIGVSENATDEELNLAYTTLRTKYENDRFLEGEAGNEAARKLTELNNAYDAIVDYRNEQNFDSEKGTAFNNVDSLIKAGKINEAQAELDKFGERTAEWHYLQSVVFYKKNWINESKKQLEIAIQMDGSNQKYRTSYDKLCRQMEYNAKQNNNGNNNADANWNRSGSNGGGSYEEPTEMMGGDGCMDYCCRLAICNAILNCCCCNNMNV